MTIPDIPGDRLAQELMKIRPNIPIILYTGHSDRMDTYTAMNLGIKAFIMKPIKTAELATRIRQVLDETNRDRPRFDIF